MKLVQLAWLRAALPVACLALLVTLETWLPFFEGRAGRVRHGGRNVAWGLLNAAVVFALFTGPLQRMSDWSADKPFGLLRWLGLSPVGAAVVAIVVFDGWMYAWHRANHRIPVLWRFHRMHHSDADLDATSAVRFHTGEIVISAILRLGVLALLGMTLPMLMLYETILAPVIQFHHSNVRMPAALDRWLRAVIVSPNMHRVHHSELRREHDSNYGSIFSFWDRLLGSYRWREDLKELRMGLGRFRDEEWLTLWGMLRTPLR
jgi:sterol desaturase/sphingolipid hydroxylase (fatty acid hydroxylase superfamily)